MEAQQHPAGGLGLIVLDEAHIYSDGRQIALVVGLEEIAPAIAENSRLDRIEAGNG